MWMLEQLYGSDSLFTGCASGRSGMHIPGASSHFWHLRLLGLYVLCREGHAIGQGA